MAKDLSDKADFELVTARVYAMDMRKLRRIQMAREAVNGGQRPPIPQLIHEAVREMDEP